MAFNRYDILVKHYTNQIQSWNWALIKKQAYNNCVVPEYNQDSVQGQCFLGTQLGIYPSGKIYTFWTTNQTRADEIKDHCFMEALEAVAEKHNMFIDFNDDSIFACVHIYNKDEITGYCTLEDQELANQIFT